MYYNYYARQLGLEDVTLDVLKSFTCAEELCQYGVDKEKAEVIANTANMVREFFVDEASEKTHLRTAEDVAAYLMPRLRYKCQEEFWVLCLDAKNKLIHAECLFKGGVRAVFASPREVFKFALLHNASNIIVAHNHPSGDTTPSPEDRTLTYKLVGAGDVIDIPVLDHLIIGDGCYYSFDEAGAIEK